MSDCKELSRPPTRSFCVLPIYWQHFCFAQFYPYRKKWLLFFLLPCCSCWPSTLHLRATTLTLMVEKEKRGQFWFSSSKEERRSRGWLVEKIGGREIIFWHQYPLTCRYGLWLANQVTVLMSGISNITMHMKEHRDVRFQIWGPAENWKKMVGDRAPPS